jgi:hypothetical protein
MFQQAITSHAISCTVPCDDLDSLLAGHHSHEHTVTAMKAGNLGSLWDNYGIVGDLIVCPLSSSPQTALN